MQKLLVLLVIVGGIVAAVLVVSRPALSRGYTATCLFQRKSDVAIASSEGDGTEIIDNQYARIRSLMHYDFKGRPTIEQLIKDVDQLHSDMPVTDDNELTEAGRVIYEQRIRDLRQAIQVEETIASDSIDLITVSVTLEDGQLAAEIANVLVASYLKKVRTELDESLIQQKKFFAQEVARYRRQISEIGTAILRFRISNLPNIDDVNEFLEDPMHAHRMLMHETRVAKNKRADLALKIKYLKESFKGRPFGDQAAIQLAHWQAEYDQLAVEVERQKEMKTWLEELNRRWFELHNEWVQMKRDLQEATAQLEIWDKRLRAVQLALAMAVSERGLRLSVVQRAVAPPVSRKQPNQLKQQSKLTQSPLSQKELLMDGVTKE